MNPMNPLEPESGASNRVRPYQAPRPVGVDNWPDILTSLVEGWELPDEGLRWAITEILSGRATPTQTAALMAAMRAKGEDARDVAIFAEAMMEHATPIAVDRDVVDIVGTGGDRKNTVNISTMAGLVAAAAGARVVKHGNRAASSKCGAADVLDELGVVIDLDPAKQPQVLEEVGIVFLFAAHYHSSMRYAAGPRKELGIPTIFNLLGPVSNPARPRAQALGVAHEPVARLVAEVMCQQGARGMVFYGHGGLDELTTSDTSRVFLVNNGQAKEHALDPLDLGIPRSDLDDLVGGEPPVNAQILRDTLGGAPGPVRDIVLLNAAAALLAFEGPDIHGSAVDQFAPHLQRAADAVDGGQALATLDRWIELTQRLARG